VGEALHRAREPLAVLHNIRRTIGEYNIAGQYQQSPAPHAVQSGIVHCMIDRIRKVSIGLRESSVFGNKRRDALDRAE
jgi:hypothetical protein